MKYVALVSVLAGLLGVLGTLADSARWAYIDGDWRRIFLVVVWGPIIGGAAMIGVFVISSTLLLISYCCKAWNSKRSPN